MDIKTKTICTIGPATENEEVFEKLVLEGMDIARLNFSHSSYEQYKRIKNLIDKFNHKHQKSVKILMDLQGPRMRVGQLPQSGIELKEGEIMLFSTDRSNEDAIFIDDPYLHINIEEGHPVFLANGEMELMVVSKNNGDIKAKVIRGGILYTKKGVNVPETDLTTGGLTEKDIRDIQFGVKNNADYIALSFVKDKQDILHTRKLLKGGNIKLIAKIERKQAVLNLSDIIDEANLVMVARGDLGIEMPIEQLPLLQKDIIRHANAKNKPAIVATQMLASMVNHHMPTRAEISDISNAVLDGAWGLMLSDETAFGKYPVLALEYLVKTINETENYLKEKDYNKS